MSSQTPPPTADTDSFDCDWDECAEKYLRKCAKHRASDWRGDPRDWNVQHCQTGGCHKIYIRGLKGTDCAECGLRVCGHCRLSDDGGNDDDDTAWKCELCRADL